MEKFLPLTQPVYAIEGERVCEGLYNHAMGTYMGLKSRTVVLRQKTHGRAHFSVVQRQCSSWKAVGHTKKKKTAVPSE